MWSPNTSTAAFLMPRPGVYPIDGLLRPLRMWTPSRGCPAGLESFVPLCLLRRLLGCPRVAMVQSADLGDGDDASLARRLDFTRNRRIPIQRQVCA